MNKREVIHHVLENKPVPYVPWSLSFTLEAYAKLQEHYHQDNLESVLQNHLLDL